MRTRGNTTVAAIAAVAAIGAAATGCSGGSSKASTTLPATFAAKVNAVCQQAIDDKQNHQFPLQNFDPRHPQSSDLPVLAAYFSHYGDARQITNRLAALGEPSSQVAAWDQLRSAVDALERNALHQQQVATAADVTGFEHTLDVAQSLQHRITPLGTRLGFTSTTACGRYFG